MFNSKAETLNFLDKKITLSKVPKSYFFFCFKMEKKIKKLLLRNSKKF